MENLSFGQYSLVYNAFSFTFATMAAATLFLWLGRSQVGPAYKTALTISGLVTAIAAYHYFRIFQSWEGAYTVEGGVVAGTQGEGLGTGHGALHFRARLAGWRGVSKPERTRPGWKATSGAG
jgi:hypothetical protein